MTDLPPCAAVAADAYHVPSAIIAHVVENSGQRGIGVMRIDPGWLPILEHAGFDPTLVRDDVCMNIAAGAWILAWAGAGGHGGQPHQHEAPPPARPLPGVLSTCVTRAAAQYHIPEVLFRAILLTEGGAVGRISRNPNGSYDMGPAQVNSTHLAELAHFGITRDELINDGCLNLHVGAWILARELDGHTPAEPGEFWRRVGNYNSRTPKLNQAYQRKVWRNASIAAQSQSHAPS
ncbi:lytic transglycosylase domain-containing protein [Gluconacetobacter sp. 1b LMG 1731]|uniref:Lytic transglycosylase domain-containing protein n=1 Tax=Gluconacetobacter dulcium TaxID=2729096 RepID=A0A7W4IKG6_9PROT|nr:lytic transglycosylase domain-containing protein [Gluconacetobacter dulcium]MBB2164496.1 lytic transglycosylase domain-containing protein [Gluconacetobacter dulcium]MBB2193737.1 lytic transglycosylase domain-containing protein [Gluconacetobacter dulcium]